MTAEQWEQELLKDAAVTEGHIVVDLKSTARLLAGKDLVINDLEAKNILLQEQWNQRLVNVN